MLTRLSTANAPRYLSTYSPLLQRPTNQKKTLDRNNEAVTTGPSWLQQRNQYFTRTTQKYVPTYDKSSLELLSKAALNNPFSLSETIPRFAEGHPQLKALKTKYNPEYDQTAKKPENTNIDRLYQRSYCSTYLIRIMVFIFV
mgnify:CR=1 FL=1